MDLICKTVRLLLEYHRPEDIVVITPFRAQRNHFKRRFREMKLGSILVSTIHRAQGSEYHTVIFDPVKGDCEWLMSEEGERLINVAISRAQARLIVTLSKGDRRNPLFELIDYYGVRV